MRNLKLRKFILKAFWSTIRKFAPTKIFCYTVLHTHCSLKLLVYLYCHSCLDIPWRRLSECSHAKNAVMSRDPTHRGNGLVWGGGGGLVTKNYLITAHVVWPLYSCKYMIFDTPGQIEVFTWSASGTIVTETLASTLLMHCQMNNDHYCKWRKAGWSTGNDDFIMRTRQGCYYTYPWKMLYFVCSLKEFDTTLQSA